jgi:hypothetical protein
VRSGREHFGVPLPVIVAVVGAVSQPGRQGGRDRALAGTR